MNPVVFYHLYVRDEFFPLWVEEQLNLLKKSGLGDISTVYVCITTPIELKNIIEKYINENFSFVNILDIRTTDKPTIYEGSTLKHLYKFSLKHDNPIFYFHTKGSSYKVENVKYFPNKNSYDWRNLMQYFHIEKHKECLNLLKTYDVVGVNWQSHPQHFSGNFWWANSEYIRKLPDPLDLENFIKYSRCSMEFWVGYNSPKYHCIHNSGVDHYHKEYPLELYLSENDK